MLIDLGKESRHNRRLKPFSLPALGRSLQQSQREIHGARGEWLPDRTGLLHQLTRAISDLNLTIGSAHIGTYGEKAVDVFYVTDLTGHKIENARRQRTIRDTLLAVFQPLAPQGAEERTPKVANGPPPHPPPLGRRDPHQTKGSLKTRNLIPSHPPSRGEGTPPHSRRDTVSSLYRKFRNVGEITTGSRSVVFVRDALVAAVLGTGPAADVRISAGCVPLSQSVPPTKPRAPSTRRSFRCSPNRSSRTAWSRRGFGRRGS